MRTIPFSPDHITRRRINIMRTRDESGVLREIYRLIDIDEPVLAREIRRILSPEEMAALRATLPRELETVDDVRLIQMIRTIMRVGINEHEKRTTDNWVKYIIALIYGDIGNERRHDVADQSGVRAGGGKGEPNARCYLDDAGAQRALKAWSERSSAGCPYNLSH
jgi:hypothetical protein